MGFSYQGKRNLWLEIWLEVNADLVVVPRELLLIPG
jgi:hypothetical protein